MSLQRLDLSHNSLASLGEEIWSLSSLRDLNVSHNLLLSFETLKPMQALQSLNVSFNLLGETHAVLPNGARRMLSGDEALGSVASALPFGLLELRLAGNPFLASVSGGRPGLVAALLESAPTLQALDGEHIHRDGNMPDDLSDTGSWVSSGGSSSSSTESSAFSLFLGGPGTTRRDNRSRSRSKGAKCAKHSEWCRDRDKKKFSSRSGATSSRYSSTSIHRPQGDEAGKQSRAVHSTQASLQSDPEKREPLGPNQQEVHLRGHNFNLLQQQILSQLQELRLATVSTPSVPIQSHPPLPSTPHHSTSQVPHLPLFDEERWRREQEKCFIQTEVRTILAKEQERQKQILGEKKLSSMMEAIDRRDKALRLREEAQALDESKKRKERGKETIKQGIFGDVCGANGRGEAGGDDSHQQGQQGFKEQESAQMVRLREEHEASIVAREKHELLMGQQTVIVELKQELRVSRSHVAELRCLLDAQQQQLQRIAQQQAQHTPHPATPSSPLSSSPSGDALSSLSVATPTPIKASISGDSLSSTPPPPPASLEGSGGGDAMPSPGLGPRSSLFTETSGKAGQAGQAVGQTGQARPRWRDKARQLVEQLHGARQALSAAKTAARQRREEHERKVIELQAARQAVVGQAQRAQESVALLRKALNSAETKREKEKVQTWEASKAGKLEERKGAMVVSRCVRAMSALSGDGLQALQRSTEAVLQGFEQQLARAAAAARQCREVQVRERRQLLEARAQLVAAERRAEEVVAEGEARAGEWEQQWSSLLNLHQADLVRLGEQLAAARCESAAQAVKAQQAQDRATTAEDQVQTATAAAVAEQGRWQEELAALKKENQRLHQAVGERSGRHAGEMMRLFMQLSECKSKLVQAKDNKEEERQQCVQAKEKAAVLSDLRATEARQWMVQKSELALQISEMQLLLARQEKAQARRTKELAQEASEKVVAALVEGGRQGVLAAEEAQAQVHKLKQEVGELRVELARYKMAAKHQERVAAANKRGRDGNKANNPSLAAASAASSLTAVTVQLGNLQKREARALHECAAMKVQLSVLEQRLALAGLASEARQQGAGASCKSSKGKEGSPRKRMPATHVHFTASTFPLNHVGPHHSAMPNYGHSLQTKVAPIVSPPSLGPPRSSLRTAPRTA